MAKKRMIIKKGKKYAITKKEKKILVNEAVNQLVGPVPLGTLSSTPDLFDKFIANRDPRSLEAYLLRAVDDGREDHVRKLLDRGVSPDAQVQGATALLMAVDCDHGQIAKILLEAGASIDLEGQGDLTPLWVAAKRKHEGIARMLLDLGANSNAKAADGSTPLLRACENHDTEMARLLIERRANVNVADKSNKSALTWAVDSGREELVNLLFSHGLKIDDQSNRSVDALVIAIQKGHTDLAKLLIEHGMDINARGDFVGAIHVVTTAGDVRATKLLLDLGADADNDDNDAKLTPIIIAAIYGHLGIMTLLVEHGADVNHATADPETPLTAACKTRTRQPYALVHFLLEQGADLHFKDHRGATALFAAVQAGCPETVKLLIEKGAEVNDRDAKEVSLLEYAIRKRDSIITGLLLEAGADANPDNDGSLLRVATIWGKPEIAELLRSYGARYPEELSAPDDWARLEDEDTVSAAQSGDFEYAMGHLDSLVGQDQKEFNATIILRCAAERGEPTVVGGILSSFPDLEVQEVLDAAAGVDSQEVFELLLERKRYAENKATALALESELRSAARNGTSNVFSLLVQRCGDLRAVPELGDGLLLTAGSYGRFKVAEKLLDMGFGTSEGRLNSAGMRVLRQSIIEKENDLTAQLLRKGNVTEEDLSAYEAPMLSILAEREDVQTARELLKAGADPNVRGRKGVTPLIRASELGHEEIVDLLLYNGANPNLQDDKEKTALDYATARKRHGIVELLKKS